MLPVRFEVFPKTRNVCGKLFVEGFQELEGGAFLGKLIHEGEPQHERVQVSNHVVPHDRLRLPPPEFRASSGSQFENPATPEPGPLRHMPAHEPALFEAMQSGVDRPRAVTEGNHWGRGKEFSQVVARTRLLPDQPEKGKPECRVAIGFDHTLRTITLRSVLLREARNG